MEMKDIQIDTLVACGGATISEVWMQIVSDVTGKIIEIPEEKEAVSLGNVIVASTAIGFYSSLEEASNHMVRIEKRYKPNKENHLIYRKIIEQYKNTYLVLKNSRSKKC
jgi:ribulose kinase